MVTGPGDSASGVPAFRICPFQKPLCQCPCWGVVCAVTCTVDTHVQSPQGSPLLRTQAFPRERARGSTALPRSTRPPTRRVRPTPTGKALCAVVHVTHPASTGLHGAVLCPSQSQLDASQLGKLLVPATSTGSGHSCLEARSHRLKYENVRVP